MLPTILEECPQFLRESGGKYLIKNLSKNLNGFEKVKVRLKNIDSNFSKNFNKAFENQTYNMYQRCVFGYTNISLIANPKENFEPFFIFPIDGYEILYNPEIKNSSNDYENFNKLNIKNEVISEQLQLSYKHGKLNEAINLDCEIVIYGIPYYYAVRASLIENYSQFFKEK